MFHRLNQLSHIQISPLPTSSNSTLIPSILFAVRARTRHFNDVVGGVVGGTDVDSSGIDRDYDSLVSICCSDGFNGCCSRECFASEKVLFYSENSVTSN